VTISTRTGPFSAAAFPSGAFGSEAVVVAVVVVAVVVDGFSAAQAEAAAKLIAHTSAAAHLIFMKLPWTMGDTLPSPDGRVNRAIGQRHASGCQLFLRLLL
jgi:hypothetical protein